MRRASLWSKIPLFYKQFSSLFCHVIPPSSFIQNVRFFPCPVIVNDGPSVVPQPHLYKGRGLIHLYSILRGSSLYIKDLKQYLARTALMTRAKRPFPLEVLEREVSQIAL